MACYKEYKYVSYGTHGVDATVFYKKFGLTITQVSRNLGISRQSVSRLPIGGASKTNTEKIVLYLEKQNKKAYEHTIKQSREIIYSNLKNINEAWKRYKEQEQILEQYRDRYKILRKEDTAVEVSVKEVLEGLRDL